MHMQQRTLCDTEHDAHRHPDQRRGVPDLRGAGDHEDRHGTQGGDVPAHLQVWLYPGRQRRDHGRFGGQAEHGGVPEGGEALGKENVMGHCYSCPPFFRTWAEWFLYFCVRQALSFFRGIPRRPVSAIVFPCETGYPASVF